MEVKFRSIHLKNFMCYGDIDMELNDKGYVLVGGKNECATDGALSNGSGKSTWLDGVLWAITGNTVRGIKDVANMYTSGDTVAEICFDVNGISYQINRTKSRANSSISLQFIVNGKDVSGKGVRDTTVAIEEYLPELSVETITAVILVGQGMPQAFTKNTPKGRKEIIEKLTDTNYMVDDILNRINKRMSALQDKFTELSQSRYKLEGEQNVLSARLNECTEKMSVLSNRSPIDVEELSESVSNATIELDHVNRRLADGLVELNDLANKISGLDNEYDDKVKLMTERLSSVWGIDNVHSTKADIVAKISLLNAEIIKLKSIVDVCPTCGQKLPDVHKVDTTGKEKELADLKVLLDGVNSKEAEYKEVLLKESTALKDERRNITADMENKRGEVTKDIASLNRKIQELNKVITDGNLAITKAEMENSAIERDKLLLENEINDINSNMCKISERLGYIISESDKIDACIKCDKKLQAFASREFRGVLLSDVIHYLNNKAMEYSKALVDGDGVRVELNGNDLDVVYNGKLFEALSGGEKQKADIVVQFSIREMLADYLDFHSNMLVLDELFDNCDRFVCGKIISMINDKLQDLESVFIITHHAEELDISSDRRVVITKSDEGVSRLEWAD